MKLVDSIFNHLKQTKKDEKDEAPEGLCPVCWGYQEYDNKIRKMFKDKQIDVNNHRDSYMLIQQFVKDHLESITLKEGELKQCPSCSTLKHP